jgi:phosphatidylglycerol:prolipoprotein diacylglycerol transferase
VFLDGGLTWYGGLIGGLTSLAIAARVLDQSPIRTVHACAPGLAFGQGIGRIGCFLAGDDYGRPTTSWAGIVFPHSAPPTDLAVFPTQLYEMVWLFIAGTLLWARWERSPAPFAEYLILTGIGRFAVEFLRTNPNFLGLFTQAQFIAMGASVSGALWWMWKARLNPQSV